MSMFTIRIEMIARVHRFSCFIALLALPVGALHAVAESSKPAQQTILFGAAYYEEYSPTDRLDEDVRMMKATGITVVRIAESTWGTLEPQEGVFDFSHVDRVLNAMDKAGIKVIVGTPTYAIPTWLAREHPDVLVVTPSGPARIWPSAEHGHHESELPRCRAACDRRPHRPRQRSSFGHRLSTGQRDQVLRHQRP